MSNPSKEVMRRSVEGHLTDLERMREFDRGYRAGKQAMDAERRKASELERERAEVVANLREFNSEEIEPWFEMQFWCLLTHLGIDKSAGESSSCNDIAHVRDRLIHLLGGDQPSGIDVLRESCKNGDNCKAEANESVESSKSVENCKSGHLRTCPESGDEVSESAPSVSITDELREYVKDNRLNPMTSILRGSIIDPLEVCAIADRIDAQFASICEQQEAVLQSTISDLIEERDRLMKHIDELQAPYKNLSDKIIDARKRNLEMRNALLEKNAECLDWYDKCLDALAEHDDMKYERDNLLDLLKDARDEYKMLDRMSAETSANFHAMRDRVWGLEAERDELQAKLNEIAGVLDGRD